MDNDTISTTMSTTDVVPPSDEQNGDGPSNNKHAVSAGLVGAVVFVVVIIVIIVIRRRVHRHRQKQRKDSEESTSAAEMDRLDDVTVFQDSDTAAQDDVVIARDGRKLSRRKLVESLWVEDEALRSVMKKYVIRPNKIKLGQLLGKGQYGCVYEAKLSKDARESNDYGNLTHQKVAVKTLKGTDIYPELVESFLTEGLLMKDFKHKHILGFLGVSFARDNVPMIVLPFMANGNLKNYVSDPNRQMMVRDLVSFAFQVALGMEYLSSQKFVHRDLAARNCMLDEDLTVKVADFGLSRDIYTKEYYSSEDKKARLPVKWMAPESLDKNIYTSKSDVWSYGILLWELMTRGVTPYPDISNWDIRHYVLSGRRLDKPDSCPSEMYKIMQNCWLKDPKQRPAFSDLVQEVRDILNWDTGNESDALYVNVEPCSPPASPTA